MISFASCLILCAATFAIGFIVGYLFHDNAPGGGEDF